MKKCSQCKSNLPLQEFSKNKTKSDGLSNWCKFCQRSYYKQYRLANKQSLNEKTKAWRKENPEAANKINQRWIDKNRSSWRAYKRQSQRKRRALKSEPYKEQQVLSTFGNICYLCGKEIDLNAPRQAGRIGWQMGLQIDHVVPLSKGGVDTLENVRPAHGLCNIKKKDRIV